MPHTILPFGLNTAIRIYREIRKHRPMGILKTYRFVFLITITFLVNLGILTIVISSQPVNGIGISKALVY
jgi:hypothetical protein